LNYEGEPLVRWCLVGFEDGIAPACDGLMIPAGEDRLTVLVAGSGVVPLAIYGVGEIPDSGAASAGSDTSRDAAVHRLGDHHTRHRGLGIHLIEREDDLTGPVKMREKRIGVLRLWSFR
jgi:hypothetical protein